MTILRLHKKHLLRHLKVWLIITAIFSFVDPSEGTLLRNAIVTALLMAGYMIVYYTETLLIFPRYLGKSILKLILSITAALIIYQLINHFTLLFISPGLGHKVYISNDPFYLLALRSLFLFFIVSIVAFGAHQNSVSKQIISLQNAREKAILKKELGFFKNQFNPHIVFNFLNYCYSHVLKESKEGAWAIERFSEMLRYSFDTETDEPITLRKEIEYITNFIDLQKQLNKGIQVNFNVLGELNGRYIAPRILINFVENAFKHGDTRSAENPVNIKLKTGNDTIEFFVSNKKKTSERSPLSTGVGIKNTIQQLELIYKNNYRYNYNEHIEIYSCNLILTTKLIHT